MTAPRITTDRARELLAKSTPGPWWSSYDQVKRGSDPDGDVDECETICTAYDEPHDAELLAAAPDLAADLIDARAQIAALTAAQGVPVEVHARAVREAMSAGYTDGDNYTTHNRESVWDEVRAVLTRCVGADRALALVDGEVSGG